MLWQIPLGNSNHLNVANSGGPRQGYKDNRAEYFFGAGGTAHLAAWAQKGVIGLLFGRGAGGQSTYLNDQYTDGQLFMQSRAGAFLKGGGLPLGAGATLDAGSPTVDAGRSTVDAGAPDAGAAAIDSSQYSFESGTQGWAPSGGLAQVSSASSVVFLGARSLAVSFAAGGAGSEDVAVFSPRTPAGAKVTYRVWCPAGARVGAIQAYAMQGAGGGWAWTGVTKSGAGLALGSWNTFSLTVSATASTPLDQIGVEFTLSGAWTGTCYLDSVGW